jgi:hypothetical protein
MCTWISYKAAVEAHGKGVAAWLPLTTANVYYDHPVSAPLDHALIIDFLNEAAGPGARVCIELSAASARELVRAVQAALDAGQAQHDLASAAVGGSETDRGKEAAGDALRERERHAAV